MSDLLQIIKNKKLNTRTRIETIKAITRIGDNRGNILLILENILNSNDETDAIKLASIKAMNIMNFRSPSFVRIVDNLLENDNLNIEIKLEASFILTKLGYPSPIIYNIFY